MSLWINRNFKPMLLKEIDKPFNSKGYVFEIKFDGIRSLIFVNNKEIKIQSRNKKDLTYLFPELESIRNIVNKNVIFDGEIVAFDKNKDSFSKIQERLHIKDKNKIKKASTLNPVTFIAFDIIYDNKDLTNKTLLERKKILSKYKDTDEFMKTKIIDSNGINLFNSIKKLNLEGIIAKRKDGKYHIDKRTDDFIKIKNFQRDEFIIGGYEEKKNGILSLSIGEYVDDKLCFVGKVSAHKNYKIYKKIIKLKKDKNSFFNFDEKINYVTPTLTCHVEYLERTKNNHLRHPVFKDY